MQRFTAVLGAISPDWRLAATSRREGLSGDYLKIRDLASGEVIHNLKAPGEIYRISFSPSGQRVAADIHDVFQDLFSFWLVESGQHDRTQFDWMGFSFSPDGRFIAAIVDDGSGSNKG